MMAKLLVLITKSKNMRKGNVLPIALIAFAIVAFLLLVDLAISPKKQSGNVVHQATNTNTAANLNATTNANVSNVNGTVNTNSSTEGYGSPEGPFTVSQSKTLAVAFKASTDQMVIRLAKVDVTTGKTVAQATIKTTDIQSQAHLPAIPNVASNVQFGSDGDSIVFMATHSDPPFAGIFRTSFSNPKKIETIVLYDPDHLYNDDIPTLSGLRYHAETNTIAFTIRGQANKTNNDVLVVNGLEKVVEKVKSYPNEPALIGFPGNGAQLEVLWLDKSGDDYNNPTSKWSIDQIDLSDFHVAKSTLVVDQAAIKYQVYLTGNNIAPNNKLVGTFLYSRELQKNALWFRRLDSGEVTAHFEEGQYYSAPVWSPDSGKVAVGNGTSGVIFDLAKGELDTIKGFSSGVTWYPGPYLVYQNNQGEIYSYSQTTKKSVEFEDLQVSYSDYGGGGLFGQNWVNR